MSLQDQNSDEKAIRDLISGHFDGMKWTPTTEPDWASFSTDFHREALLFPAARPAQARSLDAFIERMNGVAKKHFPPLKNIHLGCRSLSSAMWLS